MTLSESLAIIIPVINEEQALPQVLRELRTVFSGPVYVVDGGSRDQTVKLAQEQGAIVIYESERGYGRACLRGATAALDAGAETLVFMDGDVSDDPRDLPMILAPLQRGEADIVIGARIKAKREPGAMALHQSFGNHFVAFLLRLRFGLAISDPGSFRAMPASTFRALGLRDLTYGWPVEAVVRSARLKLRLQQVPISHRRRIGVSKVSGTVRGSLKAGYRMITAIVRYAND